MKILTTATETWSKQDLIDFVSTWDCEMLKYIEACTELPRTLEFKHIQNEIAFMQKVIAHILLDNFKLKKRVEFKNSKSININLEELSLLIDGRINEIGDELAIWAQNLDDLIYTHGFLVNNRMEMEEFDILYTPEEQEQIINAEDNNYTKIQKYLFETCESVLDLIEDNAQLQSQIKKPNFLKRLFNL